MAPDLNSVPSSPHEARGRHSQSSSANASRRPSQVMPPPAQSAQAPTHQQSPTLHSGDAAALPMRHPRPLTAAELYLELEKESEGVVRFYHACSMSHNLTDSKQVNRLTRELSALRAQHSASVQSNASHSSSASNPTFLPVDPTDSNPNHHLTGPTHPTPSRRHRSSSSISGPSMTTPSTSTSSIQPAPGSQHPPVTHGMPSQASADRAAAAGGSLSRQPSISGRSGASTPARPSFDQPQPNQSLTLPHRPSISQSTSYTSQTTASSTAATTGSTVGGGPNISTPIPQQQQPQSLGAAMQHYADAAAARSELEIVKAENEGLRQRIMSLERALRTRRRESQNSETSGIGAGMVTPGRARDRSETRPPAGVSVSAWAQQATGTSVAGPRERSESQSTTASSRRGGGGGGGGQSVLEDRDEVVRVGESAGNSGLR